MFCSQFQSTRTLVLTKFSLSFYKAADGEKSWTLFYWFESTHAFSWQHCITLAKIPKVLEFTKVCFFISLSGANLNVWFRAEWILSIQTPDRNPTRVWLIFIRFVGELDPFPVGWEYTLDYRQKKKKNVFGIPQRFLYKLIFDCDRVDTFKIPFHYS